MGEQNKYCCPHGSLSPKKEIKMEHHQSIDVNRINIIYAVMLKYKVETLKLGLWKGVCREIPETMLPKDIESEVLKQFHVNAL